MLTIDVLTTAEAAQLAAQESRIEQGMQQFFWEAGNALTVIQQNRLYRAQFASFDDYCTTRWGFQRAYAYKLISAAQTIATLKQSPDVDVLPTTERQCRELSKLEQPEQQIEAWIDSLSSSSNPSIAAVAASVDRVQRRANLAPGSKIRVVSSRHAGKELSVEKTENAGAIVHCRLPDGESYPFLAGEIEVLEIAPAPIAKPKIDLRRENQSLKNLLHRCLPYLPTDLMQEAEAAIGEATLEAA